MRLNQRSVSCESRLMGMSTYIAHYTPNFLEVTAPIHQLLKYENEFRWDKHIDFDRLKQLLSSSPVMQYYDTHKDVTVQTWHSVATGLKASGICIKGVNQNGEGIRLNRERAAGLPFGDGALAYVSLWSTHGFRNRPQTIDQ